jgi:hypothetical protein
MAIANHVDVESELQAKLETEAFQTLVAGDCALLSYHLGLKLLLQAIDQDGEERIELLSTSGRFIETARVSQV